jgi:prephenate dehydrogenase
MDFTSAIMVSANLITACLAETDPVVLQLAQQLASSGFRDTTRVGGGNPELGGDDGTLQSRLFIAIAPFLSPKS